MMVRRFARPYAKAIIGMAGSAEAANRLRGEMMPFAAALRTSPELREVYANPAIELEAKLAITKRLATKTKASEQAQKVLEVLVRNHRIVDLDGILAALAAYVNEMLGVAVAEVRTAKQLSPDEMQELARVLGKKTGKQVELDVRTDSALLGGFVAKIGSEIYDASVIHKIRRFRESLP
jgi:F-type H+-transporting ATPase subunit delta